MSQQHTWVQDGSAIGCIAIAHWATEQEQFAASELAAYLKQMSGADVPIKRGLRSREPNAIIILDASRPANRAFVKDLPIDQLADDGYIIQSTGSDLFIVSNDPFGVVHGTYQFLVRVLGCQFYDYAPHGENVPDTKTISHDEVNILKNPRMHYRNIQMAHSVRRIDWMAKNGFNWLRLGNDNDLDWWDKKLTEFAPHLQRRGIRMNFGHHLFHLILPRNQYETDHPDYFPENRHGQFHWSLKNPEVMDEVIWRLEWFLKRHPEIEKLDFWPSDGVADVDADDYLATTGQPMPEDDGEWRKNVAGINEFTRLADPRKTAIYAAMTKHVGEALAEKFPQLEIILCAYADLTQPSKHVKLPANAAATIAMYWRCFKHSMIDEGCVYNDQYRQIVHEWAEMYPDRNLYFSSYYMGMGCHTSLPYPILTSLFREWPYLIKLGITGAKVNTGREIDTGAVPYNINYLAFQSIIWGDCDTAEAFIEHYCKNFFADAWEPMRDMYLLWESSCQAAEHTQPGIHHFHHMFTREPLEKSRQYIEQALSQTDNEAIQFRISRLGKLVEYALISLAPSKLLRAHQLAKRDGKPTTDIERELIPLLEKAVDVFNELSDLDQDIVATVKPTSLIKEGDVRAKGSRWESELGKLKKEAWAENEFDANILEAAAAGKKQKAEQD